MATIDADYVTLTAIIGAAIGDTAADLDKDPDWVTATEGTVTFTPNIESVNATNSDGKTVRVVPFPIVCAIDAQGRLTFNGDPAVTLLDLGSSKVNPSIPRDKAAYNVSFTGVKMDSATVKMSSFGINPSPEDAVAGSINLWDIAPLATGAGGAAIVRGQGLPSITTAAAGDVVIYDGSEIKWGDAATAVGATVVGSALITAGSAAAGRDAIDASRAFVIQAADYGAAGDRIDLSDAAITAGSASLASASHVFTASDVGKVIYVAGAGTSGAALICSITAVSAGSALLSAQASTSVADAVASFGTNNNVTLQAANDAAAALTVLGVGATVLVPAGRYLLSTAVVPSDLVCWQGMGHNQTVLYPMGSVHGFYRLGAVGSEVSSPTFMDLTVDGELQTGLQKGWYLNHVQGGSWVRCQVVNTGASGFGCDYLPGCRFIDCIATNCGRLGTPSTPGCSGFGIGTGAYAVEDVQLENCTATGNMRFGVFFENQATAVQSKDAKVIGGRYENNQWGISDNGCDGLLVSAAHIVNNVQDGFKVNTTSAIHQTGTNGLVTGCVITGNGGDGVQLDFTQAGSATYGPYAIRGNEIVGNSGAGVRVRCNAGDGASRIVITDNRVDGNANSGIDLSGATAAAVMSNTRVANNVCHDNGAAGTSGKTYGIRVGLSLLSSRVSGNDLSDTRAAGSTSQTHGISVVTGATVTGGQITDNDLTNNGTAPLDLSGTVAKPCIVARNLGYNPIGADSLTVGASPYTYTAGPQDETLWVIGGSLSKIAVNGVTIYNAGANAGTLVINVSPYAVVGFTYETVPVAIKRYRT